MKKANVITGVVFLALSIFAYMQAQKMVGKIMTDALGPGFWPKVLGLVMGVLSLALIVEGLFGKHNHLYSNEYFLICCVNIF